MLLVVLLMMLALLLMRLVLMMMLIALLLMLLVLMMMLHGIGPCPLFGSNRHGFGWAGPTAPIKATWVGLRFILRARPITSPKVT